MLRILVFVFVIYVIAVAVLDSVSTHGAYRRAVLQAAGYQVSRVQYGVQTLWTEIVEASGLTTPSHAQGSAPERARQ